MDTYQIFANGEKYGHWHFSMSLTQEICKEISTQFDEVYAIHTQSRNKIFHYPVIHIPGK